MNLVEGQLNASGMRLAVVVARFNQLVTERLQQGAVDAFLRCGGAVENLTLVRVPGAFELTLAAGRLAGGGMIDGIVALGCVVKGATPHFDYVCSSATSGLTSVMREHSLPVGFGLLTCDTMEQALDRCGGKSGNKGEEAMLTAIEMINLSKLLD